MKMNIKGLVFVGFAAAVFASAANAADGDNKKVTSYQYTENTYEKKANKVQTLDPTVSDAQKAINYPSQAAIEDLVGAEYSGQGLIDVSASHVITTTAEQNVIEGVKLNGTAVTIDSDKDAVVNALTGVTQNGTAVTVTNGVAATTDTVTTVAQGSTDGTVSVTVGDAAAVDVAVKNVEVTSHKVQTLDPQATAEQKAINYPSQAAIEDLVGAEYSGTGLISVNANHVISTSAEENVIEGVTVNGQATTVTNKIADVTALTGVTQNGTAVTVTNGVAATTDTVTTVAQGSTSGTVSVTVGSAAPVDIAVKNVEITDHMVQTIDSNSTNATYPSALAVYNFLNNGAGTANCSDTNPCAFVLGSGAPEWKPIQQ